MLQFLLKWQVGHVGFRVGTRVLERPISCRVFVQPGQLDELQRTSPFTEKYFPQTLDHFNFNSLGNRTFNQRYLITGEDRPGPEQPETTCRFCPFCFQISSGSRATVLSSSTRAMKETSGTLPSTLASSRSWQHSRGPWSSSLNMYRNHPLCHEAKQTRSGQRLA